MRLRVSSCFAGGSILFVAIDVIGQILRVSSDGLWIQICSLRERSDLWRRNGED